MTETQELLFSQEEFDAVLFAANIFIRWSMEEIDNWFLHKYWFDKGIALVDVHMKGIYARPI